MPVCVLVAIKLHHFQKLESDTHSRAWFERLFIYDAIELAASHIDTMASR